MNFCPLRIFDVLFSFRPFHVEFVKEAITADNAGNFQKAFDNYMIVLKYFKKHLECEKDLKSVEAISVKVSNLSLRTRKPCFHVQLLLQLQSFSDNSSSVPGLQTGTCIRQRFGVDVDVA